MDKFNPKNGMKAEETASRFERNLAVSALNDGDQELAWHHFNRTLRRLHTSPASDERDVILVDISLQLAKISFTLGKGFGDLIMFLQSALQAAERLGDRRSQAMINLHLGRLFYFAEQRHKAIEVFSEGKSGVEALGDEDINEQAAELIGLFYFIQGDFRRAIDYFEIASKSFELEGQGHSGPMWLSYCAAFLGQFHRAIGTLDYYRRLAQERGDHSLATTLRVVLGIILVSIKKNKEAAYHLSGALQEAIQEKNALASYFAKGGLAFHHLMEGRLEDSRNWMAQAAAEGASAGLIRQYASPIVVETIFEYHRHGIEPVPELSYHREMQRLMMEPNIHLQGVVLRLRATEAMDLEKDPLQIESDLQKSEDLLKQTGDPVQTAKTRIEMARLSLKKGNMSTARTLAQKAWKGFSGYGEVFYPDDLRHLLTVESTREDSESGENLFEMFSSMIQELVPSDDLTELLNRTVKATNRFFGAERGGIFWFREKARTRKPKLRAACNLLDADISKEEFRSNLALIFKAYRENRSQVVRKRSDSISPGRVNAMMGIPFEVQGRVQGILYHDNSYVNDCFDHYDNMQLTRMANSLTRYIDQIARFTRRLAQKQNQHLSNISQFKEKEIVAHSPEMQKVLEQADRIADTKSTVLILGETGVGKELLAQRIHFRSLRRNHPMIIVDPTAIPETLVETELFGHEKGAFTGADKQKPGRLELAHKGTLFIDEVGEIPLTVQVKLLRALQEKTLTRVGGTTTITSDFRLIAATNRNLADEVAEGKFREDLYYRLNVIPIVLPSLRERTDDIILLARHFLTRYASKYKGHTIQLTPEDEKALLKYDWPGNIREMQNIMERAVLLSSEENLELNLPTNQTTSPKYMFNDFPTLDEVQRRYIQHILEMTNGKIAGPDGAAEMLGMKRTSLYKRMKKTRPTIV